MESPLGDPSWGLRTQGPTPLSPPQEEREHEEAARGAAEADGPTPGFSTSEELTLSTAKEPYRALRRTGSHRQLTEGAGGNLGPGVGLWFREAAPQLSPALLIRRPHIKRFVRSISLCLLCLTRNSRSTSAGTVQSPPSAPRTRQTIPDNWRRIRYLGSPACPSFAPASLFPFLT